MTIRKSGPIFLALLASGAAAPALADCCSGFWSCAATIVTEGVSCEVQTIIDTIKALYTEVENFGNDVTGITSQKEQAARQYVSDSISTLQSQSQQSDSDLGTALSQAQVLYKEETTLLPSQSATVNTGNLRSVSPTAVAAPASGTPAGSGNPLELKSTLAGATAVKPTAVEAAAPHGSYADAFSRGVTQLSALKSAGDADLSKINQDIAQAQSTEGAGVAAANTVAGVLESPVTSLLSQLSSMLANPIDAFDPSSIVDDMEASLTTAMSANIPKMVNDITSGPDLAFAAAGPALDDLQVNAESAQRLAAAMTKLYQDRNATAANAVYALLPAVASTSVFSKNSNRTAADFGQRLSYASFAANNATTKKKLLVVTTPPSLAQIHTLVAQFKTQRSQGKSPLSQALMVNYNSTLTTQLNGYFSGKSPAAAASQRDQLIAQARTQYGSDATTTNGVIALLNSEAAKRGAATNVMATVTPIPGQPVPTLAAHVATATAPKPPAPTWGAAPAWTPAAAATQSTTTAAPSAFKATTSLKTMQQQTQQQTLQAAPSSLSH